MTNACNPPNATAYSEATTLEPPRSTRSVYGPYDMVYELQSMFCGNKLCSMAIWHRTYYMLIEHALWPQKMFNGPNRTCSMVIEHVLWPYNMFYGYRTIEHLLWQ